MTNYLPFSERGRGGSIQKTSLQKKTKKRTFRSTNDGEIYRNNFTFPASRVSFDFRLFYKFRFSKSGSENAATELS